LESRRNKALKINIFKGIDRNFPIKLIIPFCFNRYFVIRT
jgi:hypothetical protein